MRLPLSLFAMKLQLTVPDLACDACSRTITNAVKAIDPDATVAADPSTKRVEINTSASESNVREAIVQAGYSPE